MTEAARRRRSGGVAAAAASYLIWGLFPLYFKALRGVPPPEVLAHRIAWSVLFMAALITALRRWGEVARQLRVPGTLPTLAASAVLISTNWLVYIWAVGAGLVLEASLGYFVNPLVTVLLGVYFLREPLSGRQKLAIGLAAGGVLVLMFHVGRPPWVALTLALTFGLYGLLRKRAQVDAITGLTAEVMVLLPLAAAWLGWQGWRGALHFGTGAGVTALLSVSGVVTAVPLILFAVGVRRLRLSTVGLLQYLNPTMQFSLAVFLFGEPFSRWHAAAFACIWISLAVYSADALARGRGEARAAQSVRPDRAGRSDQSGQSDQAGPPGQPERPGRQVQPGRPPR
jgi:chloramphenicol-sensitive protein RarD